jgi:hypothetical protein
MSVSRDSFIIRNQNLWAPAFAGVTAKAKALDIGSGFKTSGVSFNSAGMTVVEFCNWLMKIYK